MEQTLFYVIGIALVVAALGVSALGLRNRTFPPTRAAFAGGVALFVVLVGATTTAAVINARDEQEHRENELAAEAAEEQEAAKEEEQAQEAGETGGAQGASELELSAPTDGSLAFEPGSLEASAGEVAINFQNPASVEHDVHIEQDGEELAASDLVADGESTTATAELEPGEYVFYCAVPGHREGGMEGTLTVD